MVVDFNNNKNPAEMEWNNWNVDTISDFLISILFGNKVYLAERCHTRYFLLNFSRISQSLMKSRAILYRNLTETSIIIRYMKEVLCMWTSCRDTPY